MVTRRMLRTGSTATPTAKSKVPAFGDDQRLVAADVTCQRGYQGVVEYRRDHGRRHNDHLKSPEPRPLLLPEVFFYSHSTLASSEA